MEIFERGGYEHTACLSQSVGEDFLVEKALSLPKR